MDQAARGAAALSASKYDEAVESYTKAIEQNPGAVDYYIKRSTAYQRSTKYPEALADAEKAVVLAHKRARRELIKDAQLRRAIALFFLGRYADAKFVIDIVKSLDAKEKTLAIWETKIAKKMDDIPEGDKRRNVTVKTVPDVDVDTTPAPKKATQPESKAPVADSKPPANGTAPSTAPAAPTEKPKHDFYQTGEKVIFTLMAKNVPKDKATVEIEKDSLEITYPLANGNDFTYNLLPTYGEVDVAGSSYRITPTKIEVTLKKATPGQKWPVLEGELKNNDSTARAPAPTKKPAEAAPSYPTSSKNGAKNWDKVVVDDLGEEDDYDGDETSRFFKHLYKGAGEDAQRAMMKSYQESGGTVLSTDWSQVGSKTVNPEPPEGMEAKKY